MSSNSHPSAPKNMLWKPQKSMPFISHWSQINPESCNPEMEITLANSKENKCMAWEHTIAQKKIRYLWPGSVRQDIHNFKWDKKHASVAQSKITVP